MKKLLLLLPFYLFLLPAFAQSPELFNYQGVARDAGGNVLANQNIGLQIDIRQSTSTGIVVYSETHATTTNAFGLFNVKIGAGTPQLGTLGGVDWANGPYFSEVSLDATGGTSYQSMGVSQLLSVPYALYAENSGTPGPQGPAGADGIDGAVGPQGPQGPAGADGIDGAVGPQGPAGADGVDGAVGPQGPQGPAGADGVDGVDGADGATGPQGPTGADGSDGATGATGPQGPIGPQGPAGTTAMVQVVNDPLDVCSISNPSVGQMVFINDSGLFAEKKLIIKTVQGWVEPDGTPWGAYDFGENVFGGYVFYLDETGCHGKVAATSDQSAGIQWYNGSYINCGAASGNGATNTQTIIAAQGAGSYAASICDNLVLNGYSDWYLPAIGELSDMHDNLYENGFGGFSSAHYWSSFEYPGSQTNNAFYKNFTTSGNLSGDKSTLKRVRAVREF